MPEGPRSSQVQDANRTHGRCRGLAHRSVRLCWIQGTVGDREHSSLVGDARGYDRFHVRGEGGRQRKNCSCFWLLLHGRWPFRRSQEDAYPFAFWLEEDRLLDWSGHHWHHRGRWQVGQTRLEGWQQLPQVPCQAQLLASGARFGDESRRAPSRRRKPSARGPSNNSLQECGAWSEGWLDCRQAHGYPQGWQEEVSVSVGCHCVSKKI